MLFRKKNTLNKERSKTLNEKNQVDVTDAILNSLSDPILVLDNDRIVKHANLAAMTLFGRVLVGRNIVQCLRQPHVIDAVERVFVTKETWEGDVKFASPVQRHLRLHVSLIGKGEGVSITLRDITLQKRTEEMHSDFVANVSHELRSPLSALLGFIETLQGPAQDDKEAQKRFLSIMVQEANRMARLIDDLLSLSRVQIQEHVVPSDDVDLVQVINNVKDILSIKAAEREMDIVINYDSEKAIVAGDHDQMTQVFQNLIYNAIKYSKPSTRVEISSHYLDRLPFLNQAGIRIDIKDYGDGIDEKHLPRLTERFYRVDKARSRNMGGTGLGLAIVKHIILRHRGRLDVSSVVGEGSVFSVLLPIKR